MLSLSLPSWRLTSNVQSALLQAFGLEVKSQRSKSHADRYPLSLSNLLHSLQQQHRPRFASMSVWVDSVCVRQRTVLPQTMPVGAMWSVQSMPSFDRFAQAITRHSPQRHFFYHSTLRSVCVMSRLKFQHLLETQFTQRILSNCEGKSLLPSHCE